MANSNEEIDLNVARALKDKLVCFLCKRSPSPGTNFYICTCSITICTTKKYRCQTCLNLDSTCNICGYGFALEPTLTTLTSLFTIHACINSKNGCTEEVPFKKLKSHEDFCVYKTVPCPSLKCSQAIIFKDVVMHLDQVHQNIKVQDEWKFKGTKTKLFQNICSLTSYGQQFFPQFYNNGNFLYFRVVMQDHQDIFHGFKASMTFCFENDNQFSLVDDVYPINRYIHNKAYYSFG